MPNSCTKCGTSIQYGSMCGYCRLNSDITSTLINTSSEKYPGALSQNTYLGFRNSTNFDRAAKESALKKYLMDPKRYNSTATKINNFNRNDKYLFNFREYATKENLDSKVADFKNETKSNKLDYVLTVSKDDASSNYIISIYAVPAKVSGSYNIPYATRSQIPIGKLYYTNGKYYDNAGKKYSNGKHYDNKGAKGNNGSKGSSTSARK